jgi:DNA polymerase-3 subunit alpha
MINFTDNFQKYTLPNFGYTRLPKPPISIEEKLKFGCNENDNNYVFLEKICILGLNSKIQSGKINKDRVEEYENRLKLELSTFKELGFTDYILLVWTVINKAKSMGMFMDFGRGSVGSSLVAWLTDITGCDPIYYNLFFSRFVSKARAKSKIIDNETWISIDLAPDIDINLAEGRDEIVEWLKQIYPNRISKVANVSTLTGKILIKDVYKCLEEVSEDEAKDVADLIERRFGVVQDIEEVKKENKEFEKWVEDHKETYEISLKLRHLNTSFGCHASGYLVSFDELDNHTPAMLNKEREQMSSYIMGDVQCLKLDLLSLDTNRIIKNILSRIPEKVEDINLHDDKFIYDKLQSDNLLPYGLYQISAD